MAGSNDILDYASPRPRGRYRLPSVSRLEVQRDRDGLIVTEELRGKGHSIGAMGVGLFALFALPASLSLDVPNLPYLWRCLHHLSAHEDLEFEIAVLGAFWLAIAIVMLLVANNTWRKAILEARDGSMTLTFSSPFHRQVHHWPVEQILELGVDRTLEPGFIDPRVELLLRAHGGRLIHLFADHGEAELESIAAALKDTIARRTGAAQSLKITG
jgi:hypothetical protein